MGRIFITGAGIITSIGSDMASNRDALIQEKCGLSSLEQFPSKYASLLPFGEIKLSNEELKSMMQIQDKSVTRTSLLANFAFQQAIKDAGLTPEMVSATSTALITANTVGGMCLTDELYQDANSKGEGSNYLNSYDAGSIAIFLQKQHQVKGIINTINTACSSAANAIMYGTRLLENGLAKKAIVGGVDSLSKFTINGFNALHILSDEHTAPFDQNRKGLNLGEGAAFLVLEREEDITTRKVYAEVSGYSNTNDAFHPSSLSDEGDGPYLAMKLALEKAGLQISDINFINAHGTGTGNNDEVESRAMIRLFGNQVPDFASTKSNIGHTLGASGAIEAVFCLLNIQHQEIYKSLNFSTPIEGTELIPQQKYHQKAIYHVMSNSFGFGGNCSSLIFSKV